MRRRGRAKCTRRLSLASELDVSAQAMCRERLRTGRHPTSTTSACAFDVADFDRDGVPEVIFAAASAPGDPDTMKVVHVATGDEKKPRLRKDVEPAAWSAIAAVDSSMATGAPRSRSRRWHPGSKRAIDLWRLN